MEESISKVTLRCSCEVGVLKSKGARVKLVGNVVGYKVRVQ